MKKKQRILKSEEFTNIIKNGKFYKTKGIILYVAPKKEIKTRVGITVKKKVGNAVVRNKCKRQIRMMCNEILDYNENFDLIILVKEAFLLNSYENNLKNLEKLIKKVKIDK